MIFSNSCLLSWHVYYWECGTDLFFIIFKFLRRPEVSDLPELELHIAVSHLTWVLGIDLGFSGGVVCTLNLQVTLMTIFQRRFLGYRHEVWSDEVTCLGLSKLINTGGDSLK